MSETRATDTAEAAPDAPVFPAGRYGRRRAGRRRGPLSAVLLVLVIAGSLLLTFRLYQTFGQTDYDPQIVGWADPTDTQMVVEFTVRVPAGRAASCTVRARDYQGYEVGRKDAIVRPEGDSTEIDAKVPVPTKARASVGDVLGCEAAK